MPAGNPRDQRVERVEVVADAALHVRRNVHHVAEPLDDEALRHLDRPKLRDAADIVAAEVEQHQVLRPLLRIAEQFGLERLVLVVRRAAPPRAGQRPDRDDAVAQPDQNFGRRTDHGEAAEIEEEQERCRVDPAQRAVEREGRQRERRRKALARHDLEGVAGKNVFPAPARPPP